jgi:o-succinylbenzoate---CoA ligase
LTHPSSIWINGRDVLLQEIMEGSSAGRTTHETNTFDFIREWLNKTTHFELKTSGSTGNQKIITVTRDQMIASARLTEQALQLREGYNALLCLDARYIAGKMMIVRSFVTKMNLLVVDPCANPLLEIPTERQIDFAALVPYQVVSILESKHPHLLETIAICIIGGAPLNDSAFERLARFPTRLYLTYGMTETISHIALRRVSLSTEGSLYHTLPGIDITTDVRSCLVINAPYLKESVITNDVVEIFNTNTFLWKGRYDNVINSGGFKFSPEMIEQRIGKIFTRLNLNNRFFIHHRPDSRLGQALILVIESPLPDASKLQSLEHALHHSFTAYEKVKELYETPSFVLTDTQKINRQKTFQASRLIRAVAN